MHALHGGAPGRPHGHEEGNGRVFLLGSSGQAAVLLGVGSDARAGAGPAAGRSSFPNLSGNAWLPPPTSSCGSTRVQPQVVSDGSDHAQ